MIVTFQIQIYSLETGQYTEDQLKEMCDEMQAFYSKLEKFKQYGKAAMFVNDYMYARTWK